MTSSTEARRRRIAHLQRMDAAVPGFWAARGEEAKERAESEPPELKHRHGKIGIKRLVSTCFPCAQRAIRYMAEQPEYTHQGRSGRRLAEQYGVTYTPFESRSDISQQVLGQHEQERRERKRE